MEEVGPAAIRHALLTGREIALLDLREEDLYARAHPLFAANLPLSRLELECLDRLPRLDCPIILYDDDGALVSRAASRLAALGYCSVKALAGGLAGWRDAGYELFRDVNVPSKAFGELVEAEAHTPSLPAAEVKRLIEEGARSPTAPGSSASRRRIWRCCARRRGGRSIASMCAIRRSIKPGICRDSARRRAASWCRRPTSSPRCAGRGSCCSTICRCAPR
jgi:rhodanese-related sulfurtransferase